ncbi:ABC transporter permease [Candidatus Micrarchaeota archaeon]|nr:ABC transporter permease [Candidatus Micrarchaeota archaeon]
MKFWTVFKKELILLYRRRSTTLMVMAAPLLIILFLGVLFGGGPSAHRTLPVAVCNHDQGSVGAAYLDALGQYELLDVVDYSLQYPDPASCRNFLELNIRRGSFGMGLLFPSDFTQQLSEGNRQELELFVDNSNAGLVGFQTQYVQTVNSQASAAVASEFVQRVWQQARSADERLGKLQGELASTRSSLVDSQEKIVLVQAELNALPSGGPSASSLDSMFQSIETESARLSSAAVSARGFFLALSSGGSPAAEQGIALAESMRVQADALGAQARSARAEISLLLGDAARYQSIRSLALDSVDDVRIQLAGVLERIDAAQSEIALARAQAVSLTSKDPQSIVNPIRLSTRNVFDYATYRQLDFVIYGILALVIILTSSLLASLNVVRERTSGAYVRVALSPLGGFSQAFGKVLAVLVVLGVQLAVMLSAAAFLFGAPLQNVPWLFVFGLLLGFCFASAGLMIGALTRSENSAILAAVALVIPLTFVSGLVTPYELMPASLQQVTGMLPLTFGINAMKFVSLYGATPDIGGILAGHFDFVSFSAAMLALEAVLLFFMAALLIKRMKP